MHILHTKDYRMIIYAIPLMLMLTASLNGEQKDSRMTGVGIQYIPQDYVGVYPAKRNRASQSQFSAKTSSSQTITQLVISEHSETPKLEHGIAYAVGGPFVINPHESVPYNMTNEPVQQNSQLSYPFPSISIGKTGTYLVRYNLTIVGNTESSIAEFAINTDQLGQIPGSDRAVPVEPGQQVQLIVEAVIAMEAGDALSVINVGSNIASIGSCSESSNPTVGSIYLQQLY